MLSIAYKVHRILFVPSKLKANVYLDIEWVFNRLSHEMSFSQYGALDHPFRRKTINFLSEHIKESDSVLDLGCKYGEISYLLSTIARTVTDIDYDRKAIEKAKNTYNSSNLRFQHADAYDFLMGTSEKFDVLVLSHVLEHLDEPKAFINRFKGFFKKVYIEVPDFEATYLNQYRLKIGNELLYTDVDHISEFDRDDMEHLIQDCSLKIIDYELIFGVQRFLCKVDKVTV